MNLKQLHGVVDHAIKYVEIFTDPSEIDVVMTVCHPEKEDGARRFVLVSDADLGIDVEAGQFRLEPEYPVVRNAHTYADEMEPIKYYSTDGKMLYKCRRCERRIDGNDNYCYFCGQKQMK